MEIKLTVIDRTQDFVKGIADAVRASDIFRLVLVRESLRDIELALERARLPGVILLDGDLAQLSNFLNWIERTKHDMCLVVLTVDENIEHPLAEHPSVDAVCSKDRPFVDLCAVLAMLFEKKESQAYGGFSQHLETMTARLRQLGRAEKVVGSLYGKGYSRKEIAEAIHRSPKTVDNHRGSLLKKLKLKDTVDSQLF